jgi:hypothetical protein
MHRNDVSLGLSLFGIACLRITLSVNLPKMNLRTLILIDNLLTLLILKISQQDICL